MEALAVAEQPLRVIQITQVDLEQLVRAMLEEQEPKIILLNTWPLAVEERAQLGGIHLAIQLETEVLEFHHL
jgi:hypothetical protein